MDLISVVIPCYNAERFIADCLESIINQTYANWEIIAVDDGSTDNSLNILYQFKNKYKEKITVIPVKNGGASLARNIGLKNASGEFIQFLDADDIILPDKFEKQIAAFTEDADMVVSDRVQKNIDLSKILNEYYFSDININPLETSILRIIITGNPIYRKGCVDFLRGYNIALKSYQDWDFHIRLVLAGFKIKYTPGFYFINRKVEGSISDNWKKTSIDAAELIIKLKNDLEKSPLMNFTIRQHLAQTYMNSAIFCSNKAQCARYISELNYWAKGDYSFISNTLKRKLAYLIGINNLIKCYFLLQKKFLL